MLDCKVWNGMHIHVKTWMNADSTNLYVTTSFMESHKSMDGLENC